MSYTPTVWIDGQAPDISATNLNHLENGLQAAAAIADAALPTPAGSNGQFLKKVGGVWVPTSFAASDIPSYPSDVSKALLGDGSWAQIADAQVASGAAIALSKIAGIKRGSAVITFPGGNSISNSNTITHGVGSTPTSVVAVFGAIVSGLAVVCAMQVLNVGATSFDLRGQTIDGTSPANGSSFNAFWLAVA